MSKAVLVFNSSVMLRHVHGSAENSSFLHLRGLWLIALKFHFGYVNQVLL